MDGLLRVGTMEIQSKSLLRNLKGCGQVVLFGATLGAGWTADPPGISYRYGKGGCTPGMCCCRAGRYCDEQQKKISTELEKSGLYLRPRFSPGYGDFPIEFQEPIMRMLDCAKKIGLTMTESSS